MPRLSMRNMLPFLLRLVSLLLIATTPARATASPQQVKDIFTTSTPVSSQPSNPTTLGNTAFFTAIDATHGRELWKTDGTPAGTVLVNDLIPGFGSSSPFLLKASGNIVYFTLSQPKSDELWKTDGTEAGTVLVKKFPSGGGFSGNPSDYATIGNTFYLALNTQANGRELWKTDGTEAGTVMVKDIVPGANPSNPTNLTPVGDTLYFTLEGRELWKTDGTDAGTVRIRGFSYSINQIAALGSTIFFSGRESISDLELWKSDGTEAGTVRVKDIYPGTEGSNPRDFTVLGGQLYFFASQSSSVRGLWKTDGTDAGTIMVKQLNASATSYITVMSNKLYFSASNGGWTELWKSDGTTAGTLAVKTNTYTNPKYLTVSGNTLYFAANYSPNGTELWKTDGTDAGTMLVKDIIPGMNSGILSPNISFATAGNVLIFPAEDGIITTGLGLELWRSDGTAAGTTILKDIKKGNGSIDQPNSTYSGLPACAAVGDTFYFAASDNMAGIELWKSNGTTAGTSLVKDINTGSASADPLFFNSMGGALYFFAKTSSTNGIWKSDGTPAGTSTISNKLRLSPLQNFIAHNGSLYIGGVDNDTGGGAELWKSDGTPAGTVLLKDIIPGSNSSGPRNFASCNGTVFFTADISTYDTELWKTDGTTAGTVLVKDIYQGSNAANPKYLTVFGNTLFFFAESATEGSGLWKSDGTETGTVLVKGISTASVSAIVTAGSNLYFTINSSGNNNVLWRSDGTTAGTILLKTFTSTNGYTQTTPTNLTAIGITLYFTADNGTSGVELWKSDGTAAGTVLIKDICPGATDCNPSNLTAVGNKLYFTANDGVNGEELWVSDGTAAGTYMVHDITGDSGGSQPQNLTAAGNKLYFTAVTEDTGRELYVYNLPLPPYQQWAQDNNLTGTPSEDADSDGRSNFFEYAFGRNPTIADTATASGMFNLPGSPTIYVAPTNDAQAYFARRKDRNQSGLTYTPQFSDDLLTWHDDTTMPTVVVQDSVTEVVTIPFPTSLPSGNPARFFRLRVSMP